jgi:Flp pilus assembly pilin Flp
MSQVNARLIRLARGAMATASRVARVASRSRDRAQDLVEYGVAVAVVAVVALGAIQMFGGGISALFARLLTHFAGLG